MPLNGERLARHTIYYQRVLLSFELSEEKAQGEKIQEDKLWLPVSLYRVHDMSSEIYSIMAFVDQTYAKGCTKHLIHFKEKNKFKDP